MQSITQNRITQGQHGASKAVDYSAKPDPVIYAPEDGTIDSYQQRGSGLSDAGLALRMHGASGLHQFAHTERSLVKPGQSVRRGQPLAIMGHTGYTIPAGPAGAHCHWWIMRNSVYYYPPSLINQPFIKQGEEADMPIPDADNYYSRYGQRLAMQVRGRQLSREEFRKYIVGKTDLQAVEILSDDPEADQAQHWQDVGRNAVKDRWDKQIYDLQKQVRDLSTRPTRAELDALQQKADSLAKSLEEAQKQRTEDTELLDQTGNWLTKLFNRLFKRS